MTSLETTQVAQLVQKVELLSEAVSKLAEFAEQAAQVQLKHEKRIAAIEAEYRRLNLASVF